MPQIAVSSVGATSSCGRAEAQCVGISAKIEQGLVCGGACRRETNHPKPRGISYMALLGSYIANL